MKLLLDENLPHKLRQHLPGHEVFTTAYQKWAGIRNGKLLALAAAEGFDALLTMDAGIEYEQNLIAIPCSVVIIHAESNAFEHLEPLIPEILSSLAALKPRVLVRIGEFHMRV
jgi:predicted nuclease of predicted toxin-antitoxin system